MQPCNHKDLPAVGNQESLKGLQSLNEEKDHSCLFTPKFTIGDWSAVQFGNYNVPCSLERLNGGLLLFFVLYKENVATFSVISINTCFCSEDGCPFHCRGGGGAASMRLIDRT